MDRVKFSELIRIHRMDRDKLKQCKFKHEKLVEALKARDKILNSIKDEQL